MARGRCPRIPRQGASLPPGPSSCPCPDSRVFPWPYPLSHQSLRLLGHPEKIIQAPKKKDASARPQGPTFREPGLRLLNHPRSAGRARPTLNRRSPRMLSRPKGRDYFSPGLPQCKLGRPEEKYRIRRGSPATAAPAQVAVRAKHRR